VEFRVLGPVQVRDGDRMVPVPPGRVLTLLTLLLLRANQVVTQRELAEQLWQDSPPAHPRAAIHTIVRRLRHALGDGAGGRIIQTAPDGYLIRLDPSHLDLSAFRRLVVRATDAVEPSEQARLLGQALDLWHGEPLAGITSDALIVHEVPRLIEERLHALERLMDARLRLGEHAQLVPLLTSLTREHPLRERFWAQLMLALYRCGRQADALLAYRSVATLLADELGVDPGPELQDVHRSVLMADPRLAVAPGPPWAAPSWSLQSWSQQCQLPMDVADIVGRDKAVAEILDLVRSSVADRAVPVVTISGPPGVGKSALAVRVAHALRADFPDGQWYVRLNGASRTPRSPFEVLATLLRNAGMNTDAIPSDEQQRAARYRARIADRRLLVLLDDAADAAQVEPLLPGTPGCAVIVTSRSELSGLTTSHGARGVPVAGLTPQDSDELLGRMLGRGRVGAEPDAVHELADLCGHLPLALRIAAANLAARPGASITGYAARLRGRDRLGTLVSASDPDIAVRATFALSYAVLEPSLRHAFRLLGLVPGPDVDAAAAAALLGDSDRHAEELLERLCVVNLVERRGERQEVARYGFHDLIRLYAAECAAADEPELERRAARSRLAAWYLHSVDAAIAALYPNAGRPALPAVDEGVRPLSFGTDRDALNWLDGQRPNLIAFVTAVRETADLVGHPWLLIRRLRPYLDGNRYYDDWAAGLSALLDGPEVVKENPVKESMDTANQVGLLRDRAVLCLRRGHSREAMADLNAVLEISARSQSLDAAGYVFNNLGVAYMELAMLGEAEHQFARALEWQRTFAADDGALASLVLFNLGEVSSHLGEFRRALAYYGQVRDVATQHHLGGWHEGVAVEGLGTAYSALGELRRAEEYLSRAVELFRAGGHQIEWSYATDALGAIYRATGRCAAALDRSHDALRCAEEIDNRRHMANVHNSLGATLYETGRADEAATHFRTALELATAAEHAKGTIAALTGLALATRDPDPARRAVTLAEQARFVALQGEAHNALARLNLADGRAADAAVHAERAIAIHRHTGCRGPLAQALLVLGTAHSTAGRAAAAVPLWQESLDLYEAMGSPHAADVHAVLTVHTASTTHR
jgi:DNA-binding SARP family transcriptional activator/tetratricopeptide (TPR) repeat protein